MIDFNLRKDEIEFIERDLKRKGFTWEEINFRKTKLKMQLNKLKSKLNKKEDISEYERNLMFKESFAKLIEMSK